MPHSLRHRERLARTQLDRLNTLKLIRFIEKFDPHLTVCTHFMPAGIISHLQEKKRLRTHHSIVITDFVIEYWARAFLHAIKTECDLICMSAGGISLASDVVARAVNQVVNETGIGVFAAAGNNFAGLPVSRVVMPASFDNVIGVTGACADYTNYWTINPTHASANWGPDSVMHHVLTVFAPNILRARIEQGLGRVVLFEGYRAHRFVLSLAHALLYSPTRMNVHSPTRNEKGDTSALHDVPYRVQSGLKGGVVEPSCPRGLQFHQREDHSTDNGE